MSQGKIDFLRRVHGALIPKVIHDDDVSSRCSSPAPELLGDDDLPMNCYCPHEVPTWQKQITHFFGTNKTLGESDHTMNCDSLDQVPSWQKQITDFFSINGSKSALKKSKINNNTHGKRKLSDLEDYLDSENKPTFDAVKKLKCEACSKF